MDDDASIQILEADADQQYVPDRKESSRQAKAPRTADVNYQKPPVLIVERQVIPANVEKQNLSKADEQPSIPTAATMASRIVNIVDEKPSSSWSNRVSDIVSLAIKFIVMALVSFFVLVLLNPPFIQEKRNEFGSASGSESNAMQRQPASLSKASAWAAGAGLGYILLPPLYDLLSSRYLSNDFLKAFGF